MLNRVVELSPTIERTELPGFRLRRLEMFNWGTFHQKVAALSPEGRWTLVVGENGSGKTTAVDALRTLLVPPRLLQYNDASGDQKRRDRTRRTYVRGAWATSSQEDSATARTEYLRQAGEHSILLAVFGNERTGQEVTLAQILWEANEKIHELYAVARGRKGIAQDLSELGRTSELKRVLRGRGFEPFDSFAAYEETFRSRLGIPSKGALEVFNQAIGVKEIVDINSFVRRHMLEPSDAVGFIHSHLRPHYKELDACYQAIQKARAQIEKLEPIVRCHLRIEEAEARKRELETLHQAAPLYYAHRHLEIRREEAEELRRQFAELEQSQQGLKKEQTADEKQRLAVELDLGSDQVGLRLKAIEFEQSAALARKKDKESRHQTVRTALTTMQKSLAFDTPQRFEEMRGELEASRGLFEGNRKSARRKQVEAEIERQQSAEEHNQLAAELENLRRHRVLIPRKFVELRQDISKATRVATDELPFAGELIEVKAEYREWTGAIERLFSSFGISLLVPEKHYLPVARFINKQHLGFRLNFHRIPNVVRTARLEVLSDRDRVPARLNFRTPHPLKEWVQAEVCRRFDHLCCESVEELETVEYGITREGLIRSGPTQHIKDDSRRVNDVTSYVLGWSIESKIRALEKAQEAAGRQSEEARRRAEAAAHQLEEWEAKLSALKAALAVEQFSDLDYWSEHRMLEQLQREQEELEASSDRRKTLKRQLEVLKRRIADRHDQILKTEREKGGLSERRATNESVTRALAAMLAVHEPDRFLMYAPRLGELQEETTLTLQNVDEVASSVGRKIQNRLNQQTSAIGKAHDEMLPRMTDFLRDYPEETADKSAAPEYAAEFVGLQARLRNEDLPKHEQEFERFLSESLIGDVAMFSTRLDEHRREIESRIEIVNRALERIPFSEATHVQIVCRPKGASDETTAFRAELRACLAQGLHPSPEDRVRIFGHIRELIAKFERDDGWTNRVTDVRNWLEFGVRELSDADGREVNYYSASSGKSGGQKTKLAFTILASAITAQYGLTDSTRKDSTFRFVIIDEAFARTDEVNSERALKLFQTLGLQLLVVSPFDAKSRIVEDYVDTFHLVLNPEQRSSHVRLASRAEYDEACETATSQPTNAESG